MAPFRCQKCGKSFLTLEKFTIHNYSHARERPFKCSKTECGKAFVSKYKLMRHMATHSPHKIHRCTLCEKTFNRKDHLKNHLQTHDPNKMIYVCEDCGKKYHTMLGYKRHMALHSASSGDLTCGVCTLELGSTEVLLDHLKSHAEEKAHHAPREKKHQCDHCERCFYTRKDVRRHLVVHTGCKDFLCQFCAQRFGRKDHLTRHTKKTHSQELMRESLQAEYQSSFQPILPPFQIKADPMPPFQLEMPPESGLDGGLPPEVHGLVLTSPEQAPQPMLSMQPTQPMPEQPFALHPEVVSPSPPPIILQEHKYSPVPTSFAPFVSMPMKADLKGFCNMGFFEEFPLQEPQSPLQLSPCFEMAKEGFGKVTLPKELLVDAVNIAIPASLEISSLLGFWQLPPPTLQNGFVNSTIPVGAGEPLPHRITCLAQQQPPPLLPPPPLPLPEPLPQPQLQPQFQLQLQPQPQMQPQMQLQPLQLQLPQLLPQLQPEPEPEPELEEEEEEEEELEEEEEIEEEEDIEEEEEEEEEEAEPEIEAEEEEAEEEEEPLPEEAQIAVSAVHLGQPPLPPTPHVFTTGTNTAILPHFHHAFR